MHTLSPWERSLKDALVRTALIADIHGDLARLTQTLAHLQTQSHDRILCLGDSINGGTDNLAVLQWLQDNNIPTVLGNHDEYPDASLLLPERLYLQSLPEDIMEGDVLYTHISPRKKKQKVTTAIEVWNCFQDSPHRLCFIGDVHIPFIYGERCPEPVSATQYPVAYNTPFLLDPTDRYIVCVGAVGYSRDYRPEPRYAIYDSNAETITFFLVTL